MHTAEDLASLTAEEFASNIKAIILEFRSRLDDPKQRQSPENVEIQNLLVSRAAEPAVVTDITPILTSIPTKDDRVTETLQQTLFWNILVKMSFEQLQSYRSIFKAVNAQDTGVPDRRGSHLRNMKLLKCFTLNPQSIWVPETDCDPIGGRTLSERVHTAEQMRPYMREMYFWFHDRNDHLPYEDCQKRLARFPETAIAVAADIIDEMAMDKAHLWGNIEYLVTIVNFVSSYIPVGEIWMLMRKSVEFLARVLREAVKEGIDVVVNEDCLNDCEWLSELDEWEKDDSEEEEREEEE
ncbi:hypothetical protein FVEN_g8136 [Fusarium venenatum]|uniref:DUF5071 domain-containing protein n=1 Tax=Fusarium venenatum TaxID=56646 RepID=A0A2L2SYU4_9HYPO|nr:uncharacterized protein FVRRES_04509 [Fusarium venenatum]KAG8353982.1 hypothetical protein FVEN_g8136 [Fusarium venenatum]KAH6991670.1 hypothetical protein EDB82DRAFT_534894 [Fusarium venenatum]CEI60073.1 unnamed protein product [Fusarium venenatum]